VGETRVDLQHLLEDLRDAYAGSLEETILTEIVANGLDAGAATISISTDPVAVTLTVVDEGRGMRRRELARYHDIASSSKKRGDGIGFAGVGIKLGLLISQEVLTETRRAGTHAASSWRLGSRYRAPWKWIPPPGLAPARGTAVRLTLSNPLSPLLDAGFLEETIRRHFAPLFNPAFDAILKRHYPNGIRFQIDGQPLLPVNEPSAEIVPVAIRLARKRTPSATGFLGRYDTPLSEDRSGIAISTFGKVIKRGWDWLGVTPAAPTRIAGLIEVPELASCLTLNKNDFLRSGARGAMYLGYRKALQEVVSRQLAGWDDSRTESETPRPVRLDRDLERVLEDLADDFPLLHSLVERRAGGQKRLPMPDQSSGEAMSPLLSLIRGAEADREGPGSPAGAGGTQPQAYPEPAVPEPATPGQNPMDAESPHEAGAVPASGSKRRRTQYGLTIQFERLPDDRELGRLVENTIWVNDAHPAFERAQAARSLGYHLALTVALALAPLAVAPAEEHLFVTRFMAEWGIVPAGKAGHRRKAQKR
jgi:hypothetical protein